MKAKYTHKFIIYNKQRIENNYDGLVEKLAEFDSEPIPKDFLENLNDFSELFRKKRLEFYRKNPSKMCTIDEILPYSEEINIETNKVLAFIHKYYEFSCLIVGIDYFNGEDEYIEKYFSSKLLLSFNNILKSGNSISLAILIKFLVLTKSTGSLDIILRTVSELS